MDYIINLDYLTANCPVEVKKTKSTKLCFNEKNYTTIAQVNDIYLENEICFYLEFPFENHKNGTTFCYEYLTKDIEYHVEWLILLNKLVIQCPCDAKYDEFGMLKSFNATALKGQFVKVQVQAYREDGFYTPNYATLVENFLPLNDEMEQKYQQITTKIIDFYKFLLL